MKREIFYVYQYVNRKTGEIIYVGKGKDGRKKQHLNDARKGKKSPLCDELRRLNYEEGVVIITIAENLTESDALRREVDLIAKIGRINIGTGTLRNLTPGGEGMSGGIDKYGYKKDCISGWISEMVDKGINVQDIEKELLKRIKKSRKYFIETVERIIPHLQEMGNSGCHYKGPKQYLKGWQFSLNGKMIDINNISLESKGFLKVHGNLPWNSGNITPNQR